MGRRSFGQIDRLPSKRYRARYVGPDGVRHSAPATFARKGDAEGWLAAESRLISLGSWTPPQSRGTRSARGLTVSGYVERVISERASRSRHPLRPTTVDNYRKLLRLVIEPGLGSVEISKLTPERVRAWRESLPAERRTMNGAAYDLLRSVLAEAEEEGLIDRNPCRMRGAGKPPPVREREALTIDELVRYVAAMPESLRMVVLLAGWCGLRSGEVRGLRRCDIERVTLGGEPVLMVHVRQAVSRIYPEGRLVWHVGPPKTSAGTRSVVVPPHLTEAIEAWLSSLPEGPPEQLLFPARDGVTPLHDSVLRKAHRKGAEAIGRPGLTVHDLRSTAATLATQSGATVAEVMRMLGHTTTQVAMVYQVASLERDAERARRMSRAASP